LCRIICSHLAHKHKFELEVELWLLLPLGRWKRLWPLPPLPEPLGAWSRPMVLIYLDAKLAHLFYIVEPVATAGLDGPTGTPTGSEKLEKEKRDLDGHLVNVGAPDPPLGP